ncbi:MAG: hypothetical protein HRT45_06270 [Bdellovibrionales bacterium]|nr:hypothetical protein [Bdellovibrionales bacterium]
MYYLFALLLPVYFSSFISAQALDDQLDQNMRRLNSMMLLANRTNSVSSVKDMAFLNEGYIPQGIHVNAEGFFVSMYHKTISGEIALRPSIVVHYNFDNEVISKTELSVNSRPYYGHMSGLAVLGDYFLVPDQKSIRFFARATGAEDTARQTRLKLNSQEQNFSRFSQLDLNTDHNDDHVLWVTEFRHQNHSKADSTGRQRAIDQNYIFGYVIDPDTLSIETKPAYRFYVPGREVYRIQGLTPVAAGRDQYSFLASSSWGDDDSKLIRLDYVANESYYNYRFVGARQILSLPAGLEEVHATKAGVWTHFESGAQYFQKRKHKKTWESYFPYIIRMTKAKLLDL